MKLHEIAFAPDEPKHANPALVPPFGEIGEPEEEVEVTAVDATDTLTCDIPLFIRLVEWAKEEASDDIALHLMVTRAIALKKSPLTMDDYAQLVGSDDNEVQM